MNMVRRPSLPALAGLLLLLAAPALAHDTWLTLDKPAPDRPLRVLVAHGHSFPLGEGTDKERLTPAYLVGAQGRIETKPGQGLDFTSVSPLAKGSYLAVGGRAPQWYTKSPEGSKDAPKDQVPGALSCLRSAKYVKSVVNLGGAADDLSKPVGQTLEIVPLANPASLKAGGELPVQVLFQGKPLANADVKATFAGFTKDGQAFAFAAQTDKDGKVKVKAWHPGLWMVLAKHETSFADPAQCDKDMHAATLTFELK